MTDLENATRTDEKQPVRALRLARPHRAGIERSRRVPGSLVSKRTHVLAPHLARVRGDEQAQRTVLPQHERVRLARTACADTRAVAVLDQLALRPVCRQVSAS
jgi:hypothetical protein